MTTTTTTETREKGRVIDIVPEGLTVEEAMTVYDLLHKATYSDMCYIERDLRLCMDYEQKMGRGDNQDYGGN